MQVFKDQLIFLSSLAFQKTWYSQERSGEEGAEPDSGCDMPSPVGSFSETPNSSVALLSPASVFSMTFGCAENEICIDIRSQQMEAAHEDVVYVPAL